MVRVRPVILILYNVSSGWNLSFHWLFILSFQFVFDWTAPLWDTVFVYFPLQRFHLLLFELFCSALLCSTAVKWREWTKEKGKPINWWQWCYDMMMTNLTSDWRCAKRQETCLAFPCYFYIRKWNHDWMNELTCYIYIYVYTWQSWYR